MDKFDLYFSGIVAFQYHPANPPEKRMSLEDMAGIALECCYISDYAVIARKAVKIVED